MMPAEAAAREVDASLPRLTFGVLGPVEAACGGRPIQLGGSKQRGLLATLLLRGNDVVPATRLVDDLWGTTSPPSAHKMLQVFMSRLRAAITTAGGDAGVIATLAQGYALRVESDHVDLRRAESLVASARTARAHDPERTSRLLTDALSLWRGAPLSGVESLPFAQVAVPRLEEFRLAVIADRVDADLVLGRHVELVGELRELTTNHPSREQLQGQLMLALYRSGRQIEALDVFSGYRDRLRESLALDPGPDLQRLERQILNHDATLRPPLSSRPVRIASVVPAPAREVVATSPPSVPASRASRRRLIRKALAWSAAVAIATVAGVYALVVGTGHHHPSAASSVTLTPNSVAVIDAVTDTVRADVPVGTDPGPVAIGAGSAWVGNRDTDTLTRLVLPSYQVKETYGLPQPPVSVHVGAGHVWIGLGFAGTLSRILVKYDQLSAPFAPAVGRSGLLAVADTGDDLWVGLAEGADGHLLDLDPGSLQPRVSTRSPAHVRAIAASGTDVWTIFDNARTLDRIDAATGHVIRTITLPGQPQQVALGGASVWVTTQGPNRLWRLDEATGKVMSSTQLRATPTALAVGGGNIWVAQDNETLDHIGGGAGALPTTIDIGYVVGGLAATSNSVLMTVDSR